MRQWRYVLILFLLAQMTYPTDAHAFGRIRRAILIQSGLMGVRALSKNQDNQSSTPKASTGTTTTTTTQNSSETTKNSTQEESQTPHRGRFLQMQRFSHSEENSSSTTNAPK